MDTNSLAQLLTLAKAMHGGTVSSGVTMTHLIIVALVPVIGSVANWIQSRAIHKAVNQERTDMIETVKTLRDEILELSKQKVAAEAAKTIENALSTPPKKTDIHG